MRAAALFSFLLLFPGAVRAAPSFKEIDRLYFNRHQGDNLSRSIEMLESLVKEKDEAKALWRLGRGYVRLGEKKKRRKERIKLFTLAERTIEKSIALDPADAQAHFWAGLALGRRGQARGILQSLFMIKPLKKRMRRVMELDPKHGGAHHVLGQMYRQLPRLVGGSREAAVRELLTALRLSPGFTANYPALAEAYLKLDENGKARQVLEAFSRVKTPEDPAVYAGHREDVERMLSELGPQTGSAAAGK